MEQTKLKEMNGRITDLCANINAILDKRDVYHPSATNWHKYHNAAEVMYEDLIEICNEVLRETNKA